MADEAKSEPASTTKPASKQQPKPTKKPGLNRRSTAKSSPAAKPKTSRTVRAKAASKRRARRMESTTAERARILAAADRDGLTALQVQKRFGVKPVTYYSWRKSGMKVGVSGAASSRGESPGGGIAELVRGELRGRIAKMMPEIIRSEVAAALAALDVGRKR